MKHASASSVVDHPSRQALGGDFKVLHLQDSGFQSRAYVIHSALRWTIWQMKSFYVHVNE